MTFLQQKYARYARIKDRKGKPLDRCLYLLQFERSTVKTPELDDPVASTMQFAVCAYHDIKRKLGQYGP